MQIKFDTILGELREKDDGSGPSTVSGIDINADCTAAESVGDAVYVESASELRSADASDISTADVVGFIISKPTSTTCTVRVAGIVTLSGLTAGASYFLSETVGNITTAPPTVSGSVVNRVGVALDSTQLILQLGGNLTIRT